MKKIFILSVLVIAATGLFAQDANYDAVYNKLSKTYTLNPDGSMEYSYSKEMKLQTYRAFHNLYGETFIVYNPAYQELKINKVQTIMADGKKVNAPSNAFNEVLPGFAAGAPAFNGLREMVVTHPGTERNAVLLIDYTILTKKDVYPALTAMEMLSENEPVKDLTIKIRIPASGQLNYNLVNMQAEPVITKENGYQVYTWNLKDVPAFSNEEYQAENHSGYPRLFFSTAKDRESVYSWLTAQKAFSYEADGDMKKATAALLAENKEPYDIILKLQEKVVNDVKLWPVNMQYSGNKLRTASEVWKSNGGTVAEKAVLLAALLCDSGIDADVAAVVRQSNYKESVGTFSDVEDYIVIANPKALETLFLSVSRLNPQSLWYGLPGRLILPLIIDKKAEPVVTKEFNNKINLNTHLVMNDKNQLMGEVAGYFYNNSTPWLSQMRDKVKMKNYFTGGITSSDLKEAKVITTGPDEGYFRYEVLKEKPFKKDSSFYFYTLPAIVNGIDNWGIKVLPEKRMTNLELPSGMEENYEFILEAASMKLFSTGKNVSLKNKCGEFTYDVKQDGSKIIIKKSILIKDRIISPEDYSAFKALMDGWNSNKTREMILTAK